MSITRTQMLEQKKPKRYKIRFSLSLPSPRPLPPPLQIPLPLTLHLPIPLPLPFSLHVYILFYPDSNRERAEVKDLVILAHIHISIPTLTQPIPSSRIIHGVEYM